MDESPSTIGTIDEDRSEVKFNDNVYSFDNLNFVPLPPPPPVFNNRQNSIQSNNSKDNENHSIFSHSNTSYNSINDSLDSFDNFYDLNDTPNNSNLNLGDTLINNDYEYDMNRSVDSIPDSLMDNSASYLELYYSQSFIHLRTNHSTGRHNSQPHLPLHNPPQRSGSLQHQHMYGNRSMHQVNNNFDTYPNSQFLSSQSHQGRPYNQNYRPSLNHHQSQPNLQIQTQNFSPGIASHGPMLSQSQTNLAFSANESFYGDFDHSLTPQSVDTTYTPNLTPVTNKTSSTSKLKNRLYSTSNEGFSPLTKHSAELESSATFSNPHANGSLTSTPVKLDSPLPQLTTFRHNYHPAPTLVNSPTDSNTTSTNGSRSRRQPVQTDEESVSPEHINLDTPGVSPQMGVSPHTGFPFNSPSLDKRKKHTRRRLLPRSKIGCWICRIKHLKCDEAKPYCSSCLKFGVACDYSAEKPSYVTDKNLRSQKLAEIAHVRKNNQKLKPKKSKRALNLSN